MQVASCHPYQFRILRHKRYILPMISMIFEVFKQDRVRHVPVLYVVLQGLAIQIQTNKYTLFIAHVASMIDPSASSESVHICWCNANQMRGRSYKLDFLASSDVLNKALDIGTGYVATSKLSFNIGDELFSTNLIRN